MPLVPTVYRDALVTLDFVLSSRFRFTTAMGTSIEDPSPTGDTVSSRGTL